MWRLTIEAAVATAALLGIFTSGQLLVLAFPFYAGTCASGPGINQFAQVAPHAEIDPPRSLEDGGYTVSIRDGVLRESGSLGVTPGERLELRLSGLSTLEGFRGYLIRVSDRAEPGQNVTGYLVLPDPTEPGSNYYQIKLLESTGEVLGSSDSPPTCAEGVAAVSHSDSEEKYEISLFFVPSEAWIQLRIEVTVVAQTDNWYYSSYNLALVGFSDPIGPSPSRMPVTEQPAISPSPTTSGSVIHPRSLIFMYASAVFCLGLGWYLS